MSFRKTLITIAVVWLIAITILHGALNLHLFRHEATAAGGPPKFGVGFIPVTCHLTCPVTDFINQNMEGGSFFQPMRFNGFPELKETFLGKPELMPATFILAPMAMALRVQGVPI
jgi:NitT/TauT family transport system substrate-binding protein